MQRNNATVAYRAPALDRCCVAVGKRVVVEGYPGKGKLAFCGPAAGSNGKTTERFGVALDKAAGKNDGTLAGKRHFTCEPNHGVFVAVASGKVTMARRGSSQSTAAAAAATGSPRSAATLGAKPKASQSPKPTPCGRLVTAADGTFKISPRFAFAGVL